MPYATNSDIIVIYGEAVLDAVASRDGSGRQNYESVDAALQSASDEIDTYIGSRYTVPLTAPPPYIRQCAVDIAVYRLALDIGPRTEEMRLRYMDAITYLKSVAKGDIDLPVVGGGDGGTGTGSGAGTGARVIGARRG